MRIWPCRTSKISLKGSGMESPAKSQILLVRGEKITSKICDFAIRKAILFSAWRLHSHMRQRYGQRLTPSTLYFAAHGFNLLQLACFSIIGLAISYWQKSHRKANPLTYSTFSSTKPSSCFHFFGWLVAVYPKILPSQVR